MDTDKKIIFVLQTGGVTHGYRKNETGLRRRKCIRDR